MNIHRDRNRWSTLMVAAFTLAITGCNVQGGMAEFGATQGGVQDMRFARELVEQGSVPPEEAFLVEGMFSEHDLPLEGPACGRTLCLRVAPGLAPTLEEEMKGWMQVGMSSTIDPETFVPEPVSFIATVDVSGSMGWGYGDNGTPADLSTALLHEIIDELRPEDDLSLVTYGTLSRVVLQPTTGGDKAALHAAVDALSAGGSTNMEAGMEQAYALGRGLPPLDGRQRRVLVFTDVQPNVGATSDTQFATLVREAEEDGIETTVFAAGVGLGQEVLNAMTTLRGANAFSVLEDNDVTRIMEDSWPWLYQPIAYDLLVDVHGEGETTVAGAYGFPGREDDDVALEVSTVFLSKKKGALLVELNLDDDRAFSAKAALSYTTPGGELVEDSLLASSLAPAGVTQSFGQLSTQKAVALAILVEGMKLAARYYGTEPATAVAQMEIVVSRIESDVELIGDDTLEPEAQLARDLLALMEQDAPQGDLYGAGYGY
jgi:Ca-activated chloride channel family protein